MQFINAIMFIAQHKRKTKAGDLYVYILANF